VNVGIIAPDKASSIPQTVRMSRVRFGIETKDLTVLGRQIVGTKPMYFFGNFL
jgi:hypothetical protein